MKPYSLDLRERVLAACDQGQSTKTVAAIFAVSPAFVRRLKQRRRTTGMVGPQPQRHGPRPKWQPHVESLRAAVQQQPDATLAEYQQKLRLPLSRATLARALLALGLTRKKSRSGRVSRTVPMSKNNAARGKASNPPSTPTT